MNIWDNCDADHYLHIFVPLQCKLHIIGWAIGMADTA